MTGEGRRGVGELATNLGGVRPLDGKDTSVEGAELLEERRAHV